MLTKKTASSRAMSSGSIYNYNSLEMMIGLHRADIGTKTFYHVFLLPAKTLLASNTESIYPVFIRKNPHLYSFFLCHAILICDSVIVLRIHFYMNELFIQAIGFVGVALFIISYQIRSNRALFLCQLVGCLVFCVQFFLMGAYTGALSLIVNIVRNILLLRADEWKWAGSKITLVGVIGLLAVITVYTWAGWPSLLPFASVAVTIIGYWTRNAQKIRLTQLLGSPCTLLYDLIIHSWGGALSESITIISILVSIFRFGWKNLGEDSFETTRQS
jgi:hypothetical protein